MATPRAAGAPGHVDAAARLRRQRAAQLADEVAHLRRLLGVALVILPHQGGKGGP